LPYLRNTWYMFAWSTEMPPGKLLARTLLDLPLLMFRNGDGVPCAIMDRCPHRFSPLSLGQLCDGIVQCPYHGLRFNGKGHCVHNPHGGVIPKAAVVKSYPVTERYGALWVWMGNPAQADPELIPDYSFMDPEHWYVGTGTLLVHVNYELETDNILDLSHIEFLHPLFATEAVRRGKIECVQEGDTVWSKRFITQDHLPEFLAQAFQIPPDELADRWLDVRWNAPACLALWSGGVVSGRPRELGIVTPFAHIFSPQSEGSTHYFFSISYPRTLGPIGDQLARDHVGILNQVFSQEDKPILEAQARNMGGAEFWSLKPVLLAVDKATVLARRLLAKRISAEAEQFTIGDN
jgi:phenylpropionate dioxygenase-like ring-hydroxylating dioxygenase large terminal subunit